MPNYTCYIFKLNALKDVNYFGNKNIMSTINKKKYLKINTAHRKVCFILQHVQIFCYQTSSMYQTMGRFCMVTSLEKHLGFIYCWTFVMVWQRGKLLHREKMEFWISVNIMWEREKLLIMRIFCLFPQCFKIYSTAKLYEVMYVYTVKTI